MEVNRDAGLEPGEIFCLTVGPSRSSGVCNELGETNGEVSPGKQMFYQDFIDGQLKEHKLFTTG